MSGIIGDDVLITRTLVPPIVQYNSLNAWVGFQPTSQTTVDRFLPDIFRWILEITNPPAFATYYDAVSANTYQQAQYLDGGIVYLIDPLEIERTLWLSAYQSFMNQGDVANSVMDQLVEFIQICDRAFTSSQTGTDYQCSSIQIRWTATFTALFASKPFSFEQAISPVYIQTNENTKVGNLEQIISYQSGIVATSDQEAQQYYALRFTPNHRDFEKYYSLRKYGPGGIILPVTQIDYPLQIDRSTNVIYTRMGEECFVYFFAPPISRFGYILRRALAIHDVLLTYCIQRIRQKQGFLPEEYYQYYQNLDGFAKKYVETWQPSALPVHGQGN